MNILGSVAAVLVVSLVLRLLARAGKRPNASGVEGRVLMRHVPFISIIGYVCVGFGTLAAVAYVTGPRYELSDSWGVIGTAVLFWGLGLPLVLAGRNDRVEADDRSIRHTGTLGRVREAVWGEVSEVRYNGSLRQLILVTPRGKIKVYDSMAGFNDFLELTKRRLDESLWREALLKMEKVFKVVGR